jgi:hypothetical protein
VPVAEYTDYAALARQNATPEYHTYVKTLEEIKAAAAELSPEDQFELFRWWTQSDAFKSRQLEALQRELALGIDDLENGRHTSYQAYELRELADEIGRAGRERQQKPSRKPS